MEIKNQTRSENFNLNLTLPSHIHIHMTVLVILLFMFCEGVILTYIFLLSVRVSISIICGLLAGALACYVYKIGVFCMGCIIGWVSNILQIQSTRFIADTVETYELVQPL